MLPFLFLSLVGCGSGTADVDDWVDNSSPMTVKEMTVKKTDQVDIDGLQKEVRSLRSDLNQLLSVLPE